MRMRAMRCFRGTAFCAAQKQSFPAPRLWQIVTARVPIRRREIEASRPRVADAEAYRHLSGRGCEVPRRSRVLAQLRQGSRSSSSSEGKTLIGGTQYASTSSVLSYRKGEGNEWQVWFPPPGGCGSPGCRDGVLDGLRGRRRKLRPARGGSAGCFGRHARTHERRRKMRLEGLSEGCEGKQRRWSRSERSVQGFDIQLRQTSRKRMHQHGGVLEWLAQG